MEEYASYSKGIAFAIRARITVILRRWDGRVLRSGRDTIKPYRGLWRVPVYAPIEAIQAEYPKTKRVTLN